MIRHGVLLLILMTMLRPLAGATVALDDSSLAYTAGSGAVLVDSAAAVTGDFSSGSPLRVRISISVGRIDGEDLVQIRTDGVVTVSGTTVSVGGTAIGTYTPSNGTTPLVVDLLTGVNPTLVQTLVRHLAYLNLADSGATAGTRTILIEVADKTVTGSDTRPIAVGPGNAVPVLTIGGVLSVPRTARVAITSAIMQASDADHNSRQLTYELGSLPQSGSLLRLVTSDTDGSSTGVNEVMGGSTITFTQADIDGGRLRYNHLGGPATSDGFTVRVRDPLGASTPLTAVSITITGAPANAAITLPAGALAPIEQGAAVTMDPAAPATLSVSVVESDALHYRSGEIVVRLVDSAGADATTTGDVIGVHTISGAAPSASQTGYISASGSSLYIRHTASASVLPTTGTTAPDQLLGTIDASDDGTAGKPLRIALATTVLQDLQATVPTLPTGALLLAEHEVVTPTAVANLIANLTVRHPGKNPPMTARYLKVTLSEADPNTGSGSAQRQVAIVRVNDPPEFSPTAASFTTMVGRPLIVLITASDPDLPNGAALTYRQTTAVPGAMVDPVTGAVSWTAPNTNAVLVKVVATDDWGLDSAELSLTVTPLSGTTPAKPYVVSDPPVEIGAGELLFHPFTIVPAAGSGSPTSVAVDVVGDAPPGVLATQAPANLLSWTLTAPGVPQPADGVYTFGLRIAVTSGSVTDVGYQPVSLVVLNQSGSN